MSADNGSTFKISDSDLSKLTEIVNEWCKTDPDPDSVKTLQNYLTSKDRKSTRLNSSHSQQSRMPSSA